MHND
jgi:hypothetical protein